MAIFLDSPENSYVEHESIKWGDDNTLSALPFEIAVPKLSDNDLRPTHHLLD